MASTQASRVLIAFLSLAIAAYAAAVYGLLPLGALVHPEMRAGFEANRAAILVHVFASIAALGLGPLQLSARIRGRYPALHRWSGRLYLGVGVLVGGLAWLYTGVRAYVARAGDVARHRRWMVRNFALTFAAVTLRLWVPAATMWLSGKRARVRAA